MSARIQLWGTEITLETIKLDVTAVGTGFTLTASAVLSDEGDGGAVLCSITRPLPDATTEQALEAAPELATMVKLWIETEGGVFLDEEV